MPKEAAQTQQPVAASARYAGRASTGKKSGTWQIALDLGDAAIRVGIRDERGGQCIVAAGDNTDTQTDRKRADVTAGLIPKEADPAQRPPTDLPARLTAVWQQYHKDQAGRITVVGGRLVGVSLTVEKASPDYLKKVVLNARVPLDPSTFRISCKTRLLSLMR